MMTEDEIRRFTHSLSKLVEEFEGRVTMSIDLTFVGAGPDGSDACVKLTLPDFAQVGSIPSPIRR